MNEFDLEKLPRLPGSYALLLNLLETSTLRVGRLKEQLFPAGQYAYLGSAHGPGGLRARLGRHLLGSKHLHWHLDHLRAAALPAGCFYVLSPEAGIECRWSQELARLPGTSVPVPGFGSSDCRQACPAHLILLSPLEEWLNLHTTLTASSPSTVYFL